NHPFRSLQNILATPHIGFVAEDLYRTFYGDAAGRSEHGWRSNLQTRELQKERQQRRRWTRSASRVCGSIGVATDQDGALPKRQCSAVFRHSQYDRTITAVS